LNKGKWYSWALRAPSRTHLRSVHTCIHVQYTNVTARLLPDTAVHTADTYIVTYR